MTKIHKKCEFDRDPYIKSIELYGGSTKKGSTISIKANLCPGSILTSIGDAIDGARYCIRPPAKAELITTDNNMEYSIRIPLSQDNPRIHKQMLGALMARMRYVLSPPSFEKA